jgi:colicin import membrane protein
MARKLKTYQTSLGFFDLAIAAPSMKAALEAWGAGSNLFHQGAASETDDPDVIAATMSKPGVVLKRPAGSSGRFAEHSDLPTGDEADGRRERRRPKTKKPPAKISEKAARKAALDFEREQKRHEAERRRELATEARKRERREKAVANAQAAFVEAERDHDARRAAIEADRAAVDKRAQVEEARWEKQKAKLTTALRRARSE